MKIEKYMYPITGVVCSLIIGISFLGVQINKQNSIEEQKRLEIENENEKFVLEQLTEETRQNNIDNCIADAFTIYSNDWDNTCKTLGLEADCVLPLYRAEKLGEQKIYKEQNCYSRYK